MDFTNSHGVGTIDTNKYDKLQLTRVVIWQVVNHYR